MITTSNNKATSSSPIAFPAIIPRPQLLKSTNGTQYHYQHPGSHDALVTEKICNDFFVEKTSYTVDLVLKEQETSRLRPTTKSQHQYSLLARGAGYPNASSVKITARRGEPVLFHSANRKFQQVDESLIKQVRQLSTPPANSAHHHRDVLTTTGSRPTVARPSPLVGKPSITTKETRDHTISAVPRLFSWNKQHTCTCQMETTNSSQPSFLANSSCDSSHWEHKEGDWLEMEEGDWESTEMNTSNYSRAKEYDAIDDDGDDEFKDGRENKENLAPRLSTTMMADRKSLTPCFSLPSVPGISSEGVKLWLNQENNPGKISTAKSTQPSNTEHHTDDVSSHLPSAVTAAVVGDFLPPVLGISANAVKLWLNHGNANNESLRLTSN